MYVSGRVSKFLLEPHESVCGLILDGDCEIYFLEEYRALVSEIVRVGSRVRVQGLLVPNGGTAGYLTATRITNLESGQTISMEVPGPQSTPGMRVRATPATVASLAHPEVKQGKDEETRCRCKQGEDRKTVKTDRVVPHVQSIPTYFREVLLEHTEHLPDSLRMEAASGISHAYDLLHRIQAILAYLHIMKREVPGIGQFLDESKRTYEQALAQFGRRDFAGARELAAASGRLSRVVEAIMARTLRADTSIPSLVPPPPEHMNADTDSDGVEEKLAEAEAVLSRVQWLLENGPLPLDDRTQVRKIASWGEALYKQAQHTYRNSEIQDATELAQAALAGAQSAEHICRRWYLGQSSHPAVAAIKQTPRM
jgi:hypothetical protein